MHSRLDDKRLKRWESSLVSDHVRISEDGLTVTRRKSIYCVVYGDAPLATACDGRGHRYFEVRIDKMKNKEDKDGLALGLTMVLPQSWEAQAQMGIDVPLSWSVGYEGLMCISGHEDMPHVDWHPCTLSPDDRVGLLVTDDGEVCVIENDMPVVKMPN